MTVRITDCVRKKKKVGGESQSRMVLELTAHLPVTWSEVQVLEVIIQAHSLQVIHFLLNLHTSGTKKMKDGRFWL